MPQQKPYEILVDRFLRKAGANHANIVRVLKSTTYKIGKAHVLVRAASETDRDEYFYGLRYTTIEELANLKNPIIAFICGDIDRTIMVPAAELVARLEHISIRKDGDYRMTIDSQLDIKLKGKGKRMNCQSYKNRWDFFHTPPQMRGTTPAAASAVESAHAILQGRLIEMGKMREFSTFCPDKKKTFNNNKLSDLSDLSACPDLQFSNYEMLRKIDVLWFEKRGKNYLPKCAFEVELSTGVWPGVVRMRTLLDYPDVKMYVVSNDLKRYKQAMGTMPKESGRYTYLPNDSLSDLYSAEKNLRTLRENVGL